MPAIKFNVIVRDSGVLDRLEEVSTVSIPQETADAFEQILLDAIAELQSYPPETSANQPPPPYYERGVGYFGRFGTLTKVSEDLKSQWTHEVTSSGDSVTGKLINIASYSKYVHNEPGDPEPPWQTGFHAQRDWPTAQGALRRAAGMETEGSVGKRVQQIVDKIANIFRR